MWTYLITHHDSLEFGISYTQPLTYLPVNLYFVCFFDCSPPLFIRLYHFCLSSAHFICSFFTIHLKEFICLKCSLISDKSFYVFFATLFRPDHTYFLFHCGSPPLCLYIHYPTGPRTSVHSPLPCPFPSSGFFQRRHFHTLHITFFCLKRTTPLLFAAVFTSTHPTTTFLAHSSLTHIPYSAGVYLIHTLYITSKKRGWDVSPNPWKVIIY